jgi:50S ribosomal protein L16 3-hydroxylase
LSLERFMRRHWQRRPLLVRQAVPSVGGALSRAGLVALAGRDDVDSRLVRRVDRHWTLAHGPFRPRDLPARREPGWTLLVQGVDLHVPAVHALMQQFRFLPDARLDDCMVSYATDGGGVGPHVDSYDVFLLQLHGRRRWRVGRVDSPRLVPGVPLKLLRHFEPEDTWDLEPGDMLYVPPGWGHDGVAVGECMTCSVGYRAPARQELGAELLQRWLEHLEPPAEPQLYRDPPGAATDRPGAIPPSLQRFAQQAVARLLADRAALQASVRIGLGEWLTEPKASTVFEPPPQPSAGPAVVVPDAGIALDRRTRLMYDEACLYVNGEALAMPRRDGPALRRLADERCLPAQAVRRLGRSSRETLADWLARGWAHSSPPAPPPPGATR